MYKSPKIRNMTLFDEVQLKLIKKLLDIPLKSFDQVGRFAPRSAKADPNFSK